MAVDLKKRKRGPVSYKEPSSDEDFSADSDDTQPQRRKRTRAPQRRSVRHQISNTAESTDTQPAPTVQPVRSKAESGSNLGRQSRLRGRGRRRVSYREDSSSDGHETSDFEDGTSEQVSTEIKTGRRSPPKKSKPSQKRPKKTMGRLGRLGAPLKRRDPSQTTEETTLSVISDGKIPPWATLPYHVLLQVFVYAAHPLHDENLSPTPSIAWLAQTARICSTFTKPALTALYRNPPIFALRQNRKKLVQHLISPPASAHEDYCVMVKRLELDATRMSKLTDSANSLTDLLALIPSLRTLREIDIFDPYDKPPYRERAKHLRRWCYPDQLFEVLEQSELRLKAWRWSSAYCSKDCLWMKDIHSQASFQSLRELTLTKYHPRSSTKTDSDETVPTMEELLATALAALPNLNALTFETCSIVNGGFLSLLSKNLKSLNITNCRELTSEPLQAFLATHGSQLKELVLNHNQSLDLAFLVNLKETCRCLEVLRMDMHYYNSLFLSSDNEPLYDQLLPEGEIPTWPSTLQVIDLEFLRNWSARAAIAFFTSLIDSAGELPSLQEIVITAMVDVDWRQRAEFRKNWTARFQKVFARKSSPPNRNLVSLRAFREAITTAETRNVGVDGNTLRCPEANDESKQVTSDRDVPLCGQMQRGDEKWDTKRLRSRAITKYDSPSSDESGSDDSSDNDHGVDAVQGLCHTVLFRIDNSRPQEQIYDERDFLDDEVSGDEDWDGNNDVVDDGGYAW